MAENKVRGPLDLIDSYPWWSCLFFVAISCLVWIFLSPWWFKSLVGIVTAFFAVASGVIGLIKGFSDEDDDDVYDGGPEEDEE